MTKEQIAFKDALVCADNDGYHTCADEDNYGFRYFSHYRPRAARPDSFTIPVAVGRETRNCVFTKSYVSDWGYVCYRAAADTYIVRYRTGKKVHDRTPVVGLQADEEIPASLKIETNRFAVFGNNRSVEMPIGWKP
jgi:hypothetical protein